MSDFQKDLVIARKIAQKVKQHGGESYFVGGFVRDRILGIENKDIDIEIHGITALVLEKILDSLGKRMSMGESFGIYALKGYGIDIAMPRKEKVSGKGHRDFDVFTDPFLGTEKAAERRDFTVNAMMENVLTGEIIDHFSGRKDLKRGVLRHVNDKSFCEDPLRVLRAAQFAARFNFTVAEGTVKLCRTIDLSSLSKERVYAEMNKALLKAEKPSVFFEVLREMNALSFWFSELEKLIGVHQNERYHMEGDVWRHTMMVLDCAAKYRTKVNCPDSFMLTALCHDYGKAMCTEYIKGAWHAYSHETEGLALAEAFLDRITADKKIRKYVLNMTSLHMEPNKLASVKASVKSTNRMFDRCVEPHDLIYIAAADDEGKISSQEPVCHTPFLFERFITYSEIMARPCVTGKDLIDVGIKPGKAFSEVLSYAHKLRLAGVEKESALKQTIAFARKRK